jgi:hypothetical protein
VATALRHLANSYNRQISLGRGYKHLREANEGALDTLGGGLRAEADAHRVRRLARDGKSRSRDYANAPPPRRLDKIIGSPAIWERQPEMRCGEIAGKLGAGEDLTCHPVAPPGLLTLLAR